MFAQNHLTASLLKTRHDKYLAFDSTKKATSCNVLKHSSHSHFPFTLIHLEALRLIKIYVWLSEDDGELLAAPLVSLPSKRKLPQYFQRVTEPIDLTTIEQNIVTGVYKTVESFDQDVCRLFSNNVRFYGRTSDVGIAATRLRKIYSVAKLEYVEQLNEILGESVPASFLPEQEDPGLSIDETIIKV